MKTIICKISAKERILETALKLFYKHGLSAVGIDWIIAESGVAKASFYKHFPSKNDLIEAFIEKRDKNWLETTQNAMSRLNLPPLNRPLALFDILQARLEDEEFRGCAFINTMVELASPDHKAFKAAALHKEKAIAYYAKILKEAGFNNTELAETFAMLIDGAIVTAVRTGSPEAAKKAKKIASALLTIEKRS